MRSRSLENALTALARWSALLGGLVLLALIVLSVVSITGRALVPFGLAPIPGDFELVERGTAFARGEKCGALGRVSYVAAADCSCSIVARANPPKPPPSRASA